MFCWMKIVTFEHTKELVSCFFLIVYSTTGAELILDEFLMEELNFLHVNKLLIKNVRMNDSNIFLSLEQKTKELSKWVPHVL